MRTRGNYYATAHERRDNGKMYGREVARQAKTFSEARQRLDATGLRGYVQRWDDRTQQRYVVADRDEAGNWWAANPFTGNLDPID